MLRGGMSRDFLARVTHAFILAFLSALPLLPCASLSAYLVKNKAAGTALHRASADTPVAFCRVIQGCSGGGRARPSRLIGLERAAALYKV